MKADVAPSELRKEYVSTSEAALFLEVSAGMVRQLVSKGVLDCWTTEGNHRRIGVTSLRQYKEARQLSGGRGLRAHVALAKVAPSFSVLVVEDDEAVGRLYQAALERWGGVGVEIQVMHSAVDALLEIGRRVPDVLITDLSMPGVDGFEMIQRLRCNGATRRLPIIAISSLEPEDIEARGGLGADIAFFPKPVPFVELQGYLRALRDRLRSFA